MPTALSPPNPHTHSPPGDFRAPRRASRSASDAEQQLSAAALLARRRQAVLLALSSAYFRYSLETESRADRFLLRSLGDLVVGPWRRGGGDEKAAARRYEERVGTVRAARRRLQRWLGVWQPRLQR